MDTRQQPATDYKRKRNHNVTRDRAQNVAKKFRKQEAGPIKMGHVHLVVKNDSMLTTEQDQNVSNKIRQPETNPLKIGLILQEIISNLDVESIKAARQVNPLWSAEGAKVLIAKCYVKIPPAIHFGDDTSKLKARDEFKAFLSLKSFDLSTIPKITVDVFDDVKVWKSLGVLGEHVKSLKINIIPRKKDVTSFKKLLDLLPNLNYLRLKEFCFDSEVIRALASTMSKLKKNRESMVIPYLFLSPINKKELKDIEKIVDCNNIMIEHLEIQFPKRMHGVPNLGIRFSNVLGKLLSTSQNILQKLVIHHGHHVLPLLEIPCMNALTHIGLDFRFSTAVQLYRCKFSPSFRFSEKVPKLQDVALYSNDEQEICGQYFTNLFKSAGTAPSVKSAICRGNMSDFDIYQILKAFPNVDYLETKVSQNSQAMLSTLWKHGKNLKELHLHFDKYPHLEKVDDLDSSFTGLPVWTVEYIKKAPNLDPFTLEELTVLKVDSILNLKELERIHLHFSGNARDYPRRMLAVAGKYAFNLLPKKPRVDIRIPNLVGSYSEIKGTFAEVSKLPNFYLIN